MLIVMLSATGSVAQPDPGQCSVLPWSTYANPRAILSPGISGIDTVRVTVIDPFGWPIESALVEIDLSDCGALCIDTPDGLSGYTDANGVVVLDPRVGGCDECKIYVLADGVAIDSFTTISSPDFDGDGVVTQADQDTLMAYLGSPASNFQCANFNGDNYIDTSDFGLFSHYTGNSNTILCAAEPSCLVTPTQLNFPDLLIGETADKTFSITNVGGGTLTGAVTDTCSQFQVVSGGGSYALGQDDTLQITVRFAPTREGFQYCEVQTGNVDCENVMCYGVADPCGVEPATLDFGTSPLGIPVDTTFIIVNRGADPITGDVSESCDHFEIISGGGPYTLPSGDTLQVTVRFQPTELGTHVCGISTGSTLCGGVYSTGIGISQCRVEPASIDFGDVPLALPLDTTFSIINIGGVAFGGSVDDTCSAFEVISGGGPYTLPGGDTLKVTVRFTPAVLDSYSCAIETGTSLCGDVICTGVGISPCVVDPTNIDFGETPDGVPFDTTFTVVNIGGDVLYGSVAAYCGPFEVISGDGSYALNTGDTLRVTVRLLSSYGADYECYITTGQDICSQVYCYGRVVKACMVEPTNLNFGSAPVGPPIDRYFTIVNTEPSLLEGNVSETCDHLEVVVGAGAFSLAQGDTHHVTVRFGASIPGSHVCTIETGQQLCSDVSCVAYVCTPGSAVVADFDDGTRQGWSKDRPYDGDLVVAVRDGGGCLKAFDTMGNGSALATLASCDFTGDLSAYDGLQWDEYVFGCPGYSVFRRTVPQLMGPDSTLYMPVDRSADVRNQWHTLYIPFDPLLWERNINWPGTSTFQEVLQNVAAFRFSPPPSTLAP
jgi:hypothetical protein